MKITKSQVKQIIKEELSTLVEAGATFNFDHYRREIGQLTLALARRLGRSDMREMQDELIAVIQTTFFPKSAAPTTIGDDEAASTTRVQPATLGPPPTLEFD